MELSYENFITSGPDPHPPPIADDESDDDDDDDIPQVRAPQRSFSSLVMKTSHEEYFDLSMQNLSLYAFSYISLCLDSNWGIHFSKPHISSCICLAPWPSSNLDVGERSTLMVIQQ